MPTFEERLDDDIILITWQAPLASGELRTCFKQLANWLEEGGQTTHVLFDLTDAGHVPADAPISAIHSGFLTSSNVGKVAVIGMDIVPQILAQVATSVTKRDIKFFPFRRSAIDYLRSEEEYGNKIAH